MLHLSGICAVVTAIFAYFALSPPSILNAPLRDSEFYIEDFFLQHSSFAPLDPRLELVGIDRPSYEDEIFPEEGAKDPTLQALRGRFPWSRKVFAAIVEKLGAAGAKLIILDLVFGAEAEGDQELRAALDKYADKVLIGSNINLVETDRGTLDQLIGPSTSLLPLTYETTAMDSRVGYINIFPDADGIFRRAKFHQTNHQLGDSINGPPSLLAESFDARAIEKATGKTRSYLPEEARILFAGPPMAAFPIHTLVSLFTPKAWQENYQNGNYFKDKIVLVGPTANIFQDFHQTPFRHDAMPGPEIHLNIINAGLSGRFLREPPDILKKISIVASGAIALLFCQYMLLPLRRMVVVILFCLLLLAVCRQLFSMADFVIAPVTPIGIVLTIGVISMGYDFVLERLERLKLRHTMGLYFSPRVLDVVLADPGSMSPRRADVVLLLTDLRNSTPLAEKLGPDGTFQLLNKVFEAQTSAIMSEEGNLEHFLGDQFLSYWGAPQRQSDAADRAERAAIKLISAMQSLHAALPPDVQALFGYGVALHAGSVLIGNKGSALRLDYGLVGDAVNEAARIEALTKYYGVKFLVSRNACTQFTRQGAHRLVDRVIVKGKTEPVELFEFENPCTPANYAEICAAYKAAYDEYFFGRFESAVKMFDETASKYSDGPSRTIGSRCRTLLSKPPAKWDGVWVMESK
jgi:adenylate cyclase